ncbi:YiiD C-terminal domain-containing protein [Undibacterium sp.]|uniref:YiiD C-terminal domain-containing protein n=1 Tax=Undibacterium sp. TaxID=1914977 RepID=UPI002C029A15|nr:YiiD C-terminal domain-containing protein [Undibacterium sp.]HTD06677.1 YiiD C-terminal domain-containing protein [Undibacterium sp.]
MKENDLQQYLYEHIPLSQAMQVEVILSSQESVLLAAPLGPNINHQETVFGGSASAVAILAAWSLVQVRLKQAGIKNDLVIQRNTMEYASPISGAFRARSRIEDADWQAFIRTLDRKGRARISVTSILEFDGKPAGRLQGEFVAFSRQD